MSEMVQFRSIFKRMQKSADKDDFSNFLPKEASTKKQKLIRDCKKYSISIFVDDTSESSSGIYAQMRAVASEAELERRLLAKMAVRKSVHANLISILALAVSVASFAKSIWWP